MTIDEAKLEEIIDRSARQAAEDAAGFYYEKTKDDFQGILDAIASIYEQLDRKPNREEFDDLKADVAMMKHALKTTNKDLRHLTERVDSLETTIQHA